MLVQAGVDAVAVNKVSEGRPHIVDMIKNREVAMIVNTVEDKRAIQDAYAIRMAALQHNITYFTTIAGARAACVGMQHMQELEVYKLQDLHMRIGAAAANARVRQSVLSEGSL